jgi:hypothetical protein
MRLIYFLLFGLLLFLYLRYHSHDPEQFMSSSQYDSALNQSFNPRTGQIDVDELHDILGPRP